MNEKLLILFKKSLPIVLYLFLGLKLLLKIFIKAIFLWLDLRKLCLQLLMFLISCLSKEGILLLKFLNQGMNVIGSSLIVDWDGLFESYLVLLLSLLEDLVLSLELFHLTMEDLGHLLKADNLFLEFLYFLLILLLLLFPLIEILLQFRILFLKETLLMFQLYNFFVFKFQKLKKGRHSIVIALIADLWQSLNVNL